MRKKEIVIGGTYQVKVSGQLVSVKLTGRSSYGGWAGTNLSTGRTIHIRTAGRLRAAVDDAALKGMIPSARLTAKAVELRYVGSVYYIDHDLYLVAPGKKPKLIGHHVAEAEAWLAEKAG